MAAYAAVVSLINTISLEQIPHPTRSHTPAETEPMESIFPNLVFFQEFLEEEWTEAQHLEGRIADAARAAEDAIESNIVDQVLAGSDHQLCRDLLEVLEDMDSIKNEALLIKATGKVKDLHQIPRSSISLASSTSRAASFEKHKMVGFDEEKLRIMEELAGQHSRSRQVITIVGMGGGGKTTLARNVFDDPYTLQYFDIRAWVTVSREYNVREIFRGILSGLGEQAHRNSAESLDTFSDEMLGERVHKSLSGRRYLVVLDDIWSVECWDSVQRYFPDNNNGSRVVATTRLSNLANQMGTGRRSLDMKFLDEDTSWTLFCDQVFAQKSCPHQELEEIGKKIARHCRGLPLALVVIGGLLKKSSMTLEFWEQVAENVSSTLSLDVEEHCLKILYSSYDHLPVHLKPCFLYLGVFPEDYRIHVSELTKLWIAEGFLQPCKGKSWEEIADNFLKDLIERNLIFIHELGSSGKIKSCKIHDMLRDLSIREALKEKFLCMIGGQDLENPLVTGTRLVFNQHVLENTHCEIVHPLKTLSIIRSLLCNYDEGHGALPALSYRLLRVLNVVDKHSYKPSFTEDKYPLEAVLRLVNSRYLAFRTDWKSNSVFPSSICQLRNIQTLVVRGTLDPTFVPFEIWDMPQLRHIKFDTIALPDPIFGQDDQHDDIVLKHLQTLKKVSSFRCSKETVKKIPNIKKLRIDYDETPPMEHKEWPHFSLQNLGCFQTLESFHFSFLKYKVDRNVLIQNIAFPHSLKKLSLHGCGLFWEDMTMIGSLPHLEVLNLRIWSFKGAAWNPTEGEFLSLKFLRIETCDDLVNWNANSSHFPRLEQLLLERLDKLEEIPLDFGDIPTLCFIKLQLCSNSAVESAKNILDEQESLGNVGIRVHVLVLEKNELESLASENFRVETCNIL